MIDSSGIYTITNLINGKIYVGSACSFRKRWNVHRHTLRQNKHHCKHLQSAWNKYGEDSFIFEILVEVDKEYLLSTEQYWLNMLNSSNREFGYNSSPIVGRGIYQHTQSTKDKISKLMKKHPVVPLNDNNEIIKEFDSIMDCAKYFDVYKDSIRMMLKRGVEKGLINKYKIVYKQNFMK